MLEYEEALARILAAMPKSVPERVSLSQAQNRILAEQIRSAVDLPGFDNSAMDGYAVRSRDVSRASKETPIRLRIIGKSAAGEPFNGEVATGACVRLFTGSALPRGADAVVMQEDTAPADTSSDVLITDSAKPWENVRLQGEDVKRGTIILETGERLSASRIGLLAATGHTEVPVGRQPVVGLLATGSELREGATTLEPGQIYESNRVTLECLCRGAGAIPRILPLVIDELAVTRQALESALDECDVVITSGGVSVGEMDFVKAAFEQSGGELQFWKVAIRPGRPFVFGKRQGKFLFGLPGNPVSAFVTFLLLVRPAVLQLQGANETGLGRHPGKLGEPLNNHGARRHFVRVKVSDEGEVFSAGAQSSHMLSSMANSDGLVDVPPDIVLPAGALVTVLRWD